MPIRTLQNLTPNTRYAVKIQAFNNLGVGSGYSEAMDLLTTAPIPISARDENIVFSMPGQLIAGVTSGRYIIQSVSGVLVTQIEANIRVVDHFNDTQIAVYHNDMLLVTLDLTVGMDKTIIDGSWTFVYGDEISIATIVVGSGTFASDLVVQLA